MSNPNAVDQAILRYTSAYATSDDGSFISPPKRRDGSSAIQGAQAIGTTSTTATLSLNVHGIKVSLDPLHNVVTIAVGAASRSFSVSGFTQWTIMDLAPVVTDPQYVMVDMGAGMVLEVYAMFPGVVRFMNSGNRVVFTSNVPPNFATNADLDAIQLNNDNWWFLGHTTSTLTSGQLVVNDGGMFSLTYDTDASTLAWRLFLCRCDEDELRIRPTGPLQFAQVFWLAWWKQTETGNASVEKQTNFDTMSGATLAFWARQLGVEVDPTSTDARLRTRVKGRILKRHGVIQPQRVINAVRTMIGTTSPGGIAVFNNVDSSGVWQPRFVRVQIDASLLQGVAYDPSEYAQVVQDIHDALVETLPVTIALEVVLTGGGVWDTDIYDTGVYG